LPLVYDELRAMAGQMMRAGRPGHTLQPTALVHEAWLKIDRAAGGGGELRDRQHFLAVAATAMRQILVNHARDRRAQKRGGDVVRVPLDDHLDIVESKAGSVVELDDVLQRFAQGHARAAKVVELRVFGGLSIERRRAHARRRREHHQRGLAVRPRLVGARVAGWQEGRRVARSRGGGRLRHPSCHRWACGAAATPA
jgi:RNA polymerase sigma factor (TIGR02999 family)